MSPERGKHQVYMTPSGGWTAHYMILSSVGFGGSSSWVRGSRGPAFPRWSFQHTQFLMKGRAGSLCDFLLNPVPDGHLQTLRHRHQHKSNHYHLTLNGFTWGLNVYLLQLLLLDHLSFFGCDDPSWNKEDLKKHILHRLNWSARARMYSRQRVHSTRC